MYVIMGQQDMAYDEKELRESAFAGSVSLYGSWRERRIFW